MDVEPSLPAQVAAIAPAQVAVAPVVPEPADAEVAMSSVPVVREAYREPASEGQDGYRPTCTQAQLRRFIKSRPWIPMHELRRRFGIDGGDDDVSPIRVGDHTLFIGLPPSEGRMIAELLGSDVGYELSLDPCTPVVIGVYPLRPVPRS